VSERMDPVASRGEADPSAVELSSPGTDSSFAVRLGGVFAPICTPFARDESIDDDALRENMARYSSSGLLGYLALGSNGENRSLTEEERLVVLDTIVRHKGEGQVVMAGATYDAQRDT
jgi:4-hydroxy-2-oxoglutarate aldolase